SLHLLGNVRVNDDGTEYKKPFKNSLLNLLWPIIEPAYEHAFKKAQISNIDDDVKTLVKPPLRRFRTAWKLPDLPAVPGTADPDVAAESLQVNYEWVGIEARLAGTVTHRILQQISQGLMDVPETGLQEVRPVLERWLTELGATDDQRNPIRRRVEQAVAGILADDKGRWLLQGEGEAEFALSGIEDGRVVSIVIDRVRIEADGTHWIIDYKTSSHEGGDLEGFLRAERERYREQLTRYAAMYRAYSGAEVRSALYFPLLQEFVEVKV
ncbi:MAG: hypothetical protein HKN77_01530, partial [Woeseiaceae bacterium]|nr:hypothetical protein [Woeseiaceae bacterium]